MLKTTYWNGSRRARQRRTRAEQRRTGDRADRADGDRAVVDLERERLPSADEPDDRREPDPVVAVPEDGAQDACRDPGDADEPDEGGQAPREREEAWAVQRVRARVPAFAFGQRLDRRRERYDMLAVFGDRDQERLALLGELERVGARIEHAVPALELRPVDRQVGLVDQLIRV
jgi:hypothetical protein